MRTKYLSLLFLLLFTPQLVQAQSVPEPEAHIGFEPGENYKLADYEQLESYYRAVAQASDRVLLQEIGRTHHGRPLLMLIISSEENLANLEQYREISERLARARGLDDDQAKELAREGKAVVWIDSGLHSSELAHSQHNPHFVYHMTTDESEETRRMREEVILLNMPLMNPDGHERVVDWYRTHQGTEFEQSGLPVVYHEYIGHDNNRDWYMLLQNESKAVGQVLYNEWYPQIVLNHHQMGQMPPRMFIPPFDDPVNPNIPALAVRGTNLVGEHMANRFAAEQKSGIIQGISFNMWWNGGMRTAPYFHNMVGILTESTHSSPVPRFWEKEDIPETIVRGSKEISMKDPSVFYPDPWEGGWSSIGQMVEYHLTASLGVMDIAMKRKDDWLYNIYQMGRDAIRAGEEGAPYAYLVPPDQWDGPESIEMLRVLERGGIEIHRLTQPFEWNGALYPEGSYLIYAGQAFRPHLIDMMEPQSYPDRRLYPDGPPEPPYDMAGWTLPIQMGVDVIRMDKPVDLSARRVSAVEPFDAEPITRNSEGWLIPSKSNMSAILVNRLLAGGERVFRAEDSLNLEGEAISAGGFFVEASRSAGREIEELSREYGLSVQSLFERPSVPLNRLEPPKVGMYQSWTSNIDEGWTRWIFDNYGFDYTTLRDEDIRKGDLSSYDVIILPAQSPESMLKGNEPGTMPEKYTGGLGAEGAYHLKRYTESGGMILAWDGATDFVMNHFGLPVRSHLRNTSREEFFIPGSLVQVDVDNQHPMAYGVQPEAGVFFVTRGGSQSRSFSIVEPAEVEGVRGEEPAVEVIARFAEENILLSGWALGEDRWLAGRPAAVRVAAGEGEVVLLGFRPQLRAQPRVSFKFLFNAIYGSAMEGLAPVEPARPFRGEKP
ncbi:MAG: M14 metallopeptidase family protein [Balneolaceae bacterium]